MIKDTNADQKTIDGFGDEWVRFNQSKLPEHECKELFESYFSIFPWHILPKDAKGIDVGCGSGRWAKLVAPRVGCLYCIDPSDALDVARKNLAQYNNCKFYNASVDAMPIDDSSMDFGYSLGVLHHVPDTQAGIEACVKKLKYGAPFLIYLYYDFDNRPWWFSSIWRWSDVLRKIISRLPRSLKYFITQMIAILVYYPLAKTCRLVEKMGFDLKNLPLWEYRNLSFYTMRTDALDRFGTRLEKRFSRKQIKDMMEQAGFERIEFSSNVPYWCAIGYRCKKP